MSFNVRTFTSQNIVQSVTPLTERDNRIVGSRRNILALTDQYHVYCGSVVCVSVLVTSADTRVTSTHIGCVRDSTVTGCVVQWQCHCEKL